MSSATCDMDKSSDAWRIWSRLAAIGVMAALLSLPAWNLLVDPFGVFGMPWAYQGPAANERYLKVQHLLDNHGLHDTFVVGSSVVGAVDPQEVDGRLGLEDGQAYNLSFFAARPGEILAVLKALKAKGVAIRHAVYGIEPIAFSDPKTYGAAYWQHPAVSGDAYPSFLAGNLVARSLTEGMDKVAGNLGSPFIRYDLGKGTYFLDKFERERAKDPAGYAKAHLNAKDWSVPPWVEQRFGEFAELAAWFRQTQVDVRFYLNPLSPPLARAYGQARLAEFKGRIMQAGKLDGLADCTRILDGQAVDAFYDAKHFRPGFSTRVLDCGPGAIKPP